MAFDFLKRCLGKPVPTAKAEPVPGVVMQPTSPGGKGKPVRNPVKDTLFGNLPLDQWPPPGDDGIAFPWSVFDQARNHLQAGQVPEAIACWQSIIATPSLESLHYVQAWHFLRQNGVNPSEEEAKLVYGVVGEQGASGLLTAVFIDGQARVYSDQGQAIVWLHPDASLDPLIEETIGAASLLVLKMKQNDPRLSLSASSTNSISVLTPSGIYLKTGAPNSFESTPLIKPIAEGLGKILAALMEKSKKS